MAIAPGRVGVGGADGVAVACFTVDLFALVAIDSVIAHEGKGTLRDKLADDESRQEASEMECGPGSGGEDALIAGFVALAEGAECSHEVGDGSSSGGEEGRGHKGGEACKGWLAKGRCQGEQQRGGFGW